MVCIPDIVSTVTITAPSSGPIIGNSLLGDVPFVIATGGEINEPGGGGPLNSSTPCPPTGQQLRMDPTVVKALQKAWRDSKPGTRAGVRHEEGGWLYAKNGKIIVARGKPGGSETIDLSNPPKIGGAHCARLFSVCRSA